MTEKNFVNGMIVKTPTGNTPDFIKLKISFKTEDFIKWLENNTNMEGWCSVDVKEGRSGKIYAEKNSWVKGETNNKTSVTSEDAPF